MSLQLHFEIVKQIAKSIALTELTESGNTILVTSKPRGRAQGNYGYCTSKPLWRFAPSKHWRLRANSRRSRVQQACAKTAKLYAESTFNLLGLYADALQVIPFFSTPKEPRNHAA